MDEFSHGLWFLIIKLMDEYIRTNSIVEGYQQQRVIHLIYHQGFPVEASDEGPQALIFSLFYSQQAGLEAFMPLSSNKVVDEQLI